MKFLSLAPVYTVRKGLVRYKLNFVAQVECLHRDPGQLSVAPQR